MKNDYGGVVWTNHAIDRMRERGINQGDAWATWRKPDSSEFNSSKGAWVYHKNCNGENVEVVAKKNEKGDWIILSVWDKKFEERKRNISKQTFLKKILKSLGIG